MFTIIEMESLTKDCVPPIRRAKMLVRFRAFIRKQERKTIEEVKRWEKFNALVEIANDRQLAVVTLLHDIGYTHAAYQKFIRGERTPPQRFLEFFEAIIQQEMDERDDGECNES